MRFLVSFLLIAGAAVAAGPSKSDAAIEAEIRSRLSKSKIAENNFEIRVQNGTAIWTGITNVVQHKGAATRMAKAAGATRVDNRIRIGEAARAKAAAKMTAAASKRRTEPRTEQPARTTEPAAAAAPKGDVLAPPPVRRAVVKRQEQQ